MDILTKKGLETINQVSEAIAIWHENYPKFQYNETPNKKPADIDGVITCCGVVKAIVEIKCRVSMTIKQFDEQYSGKWLVTYDKVARGIKLSEALQVPFIGFLYFPREKTLLVQKIFDPDAGVQAEMTIKRTETQATINGGQIWRDNAYIDMKASKRLT